MTDDFIFSYSDIVYTEEIVAKLLDSDADISAIVDVDWKEHYVGRNLHPVSEAELVKTNSSGIVRIGKDEVSPKEAHGEFIGLARFSKTAVEKMKTIFHRENSEPDRPFHHASTFRKAYITDMLQELVDNGMVVESVDIEGGWSEIDTSQDLERARKLFG